MGHTAEHYLKPQRNQSLSAADNYVHLQLIFLMLLLPAVPANFNTLSSLYFLSMMPAKGGKIYKKHNHMHFSIAYTTMVIILIKVNEHVLCSKTAVLILSSYKRRKYFLLVSVSKAGRRKASRLK